MGRLLGLLCLAFLFAACAPLYGGKPEGLKNPPRKKKPAETAEAAPEIKYVDDCNANFSDDPKKAHPQTPMSRQLYDAAESALDQSDKAKEDSMKVSLLKEAIDKYRNALIKDPYNVPATLKLMERLGLKITDFDVVELNEAFASQGIAVLRGLGLPEAGEHVNPHGGAIALGHPLGASGARLATTAVNQLHSGGGRYALCTMCIGVGQGIALILEKV